MNTKVLDYTVTLTATDCPHCAIVFGVPGRFLDERRKDKATFYCPNGHSMSYIKSEADRLREQLEQAQMREANLRDDLNVEVASHRATKEQLTQTRNRIAKGVCPCCSRTFANLGRHMATKHPDFTEPR